MRVDRRVRRERRREHRLNMEIRVPQVRVSGPDGESLGIMLTKDALRLADEKGLDLVEIAPMASPPACKIIDYGKLLYEKAKKEKESKKSQHQVKVKEVKFKPTIEEHDFQFKLKHAREFIEKGNKVKLTCFFRGREILHPELGRRVVKKAIEELKDISQVESSSQMGKTLITVLAPFAKKKGEKKKKE
ncbi:MAG: Translation initiation factor IF-3 [Chlamydiae bacterium]|nr:Translation initiation factor IF-3 [Chlamydiota bacterium]